MAAAQAVLAGLLPDHLCNLQQIPQGDVFQVGGLEAGFLQDVRAVEQSRGAAIERNTIHPSIHSEAGDLVRSKLGEINLIGQVHIASREVCQVHIRPAVAHQNNVRQLVRDAGRESRGKSGLDIFFNHIDNVQLEVIMARLLVILLSGSHTYYEFQISARNTVYEVFYIWTDAYQSGGWSSRPEFDVVKNNARVFGGNHDRQGTYFWNGDHPRGTRWAFLNWDMPGMRSAVSVEGFLNDPSRPSKGWYAEIAFSWEGMRDLAGGRSLPPKDGDVWSLFLGRYNNLPLNGGNVSVGWSWDPVGSDDNHRPEAFTRFRFSQEYVEDL